MLYRNTQSIELQVNNGPLIRPGEWGEISEDAAAWPGVRNWIEMGWLCPPGVDFTPPAAPEVEETAPEPSTLLPNEAATPPVADDTHEELE